MQSLTARVALMSGTLLMVQGGTLWLLGQPPLCTCGYLKLWEGVVLSSGTSQHLADWYTFSHVIHGILFYGLLWKFFPTWSVGQRLVLALGIEVAWEILENTPLVINAYRQQALAQGYTGDSIINSLSDTAAMVGGFWLARRLPVWSVVGLVLLMEGFVGYVIRDNLTLNILNFIYSVEAIETWQRGTI